MSSHLCRPPRRDARPRPAVKLLPISVCAATAAAPPERAPRPLRPDDGGGGWCVPRWGRMAPPSWRHGVSIPKQVNARIESFGHNVVAEFWQWLCAADWCAALDGSLPWRWSQEVARQGGALCVHGT
ncbi:hypothetical protein Vretimale_4188 [Volvox reticuliferus]|uniref:Uncharacterized protein n=1 Tax=Volvox reticuliferus TaxID=1737510 RepID=A0A8J4G448_9CHLO|nr:hypothetical protein Vretifemale_2838 [Volvox reticuliferus]GIL98958.1 hypothetical protein Vretimale_4188 [Volvox reticuliferus]